MQLGLLEIFSCYGLLAAQSREPNVERLKRLEQRSDLAELAALCRVCLVQDAKFGFLRLDRLLGNHVDQVEVPISRQLIAEFISFVEVITGLEKKHRNIRQMLANQVENDNILRLKTAGEAGAAVWSSLQRARYDLRGSERFEEFEIRRRRHISSTPILCASAGFSRFPRSSTRDEDNAFPRRMTLLLKDRNGIFQRCFLTKRDHAS